MHKLQQYNTVKHIGCKEAGTVGGSQISSVPNSRPSACAVTKKGSTLRQLGLKYELRSTLIGTRRHMTNLSGAK